MSYFEPQNKIARFQTLTMLSTQLFRVRCDVLLSSSLFI